jgi:DNA-binding protein HU-beta
MTQADLIAAVSAETKLSKTDTAKLIAGLTAVLVSALENGEDVAIQGLGKLKVTERSEHDGRNPRTGQSVRVAATKRVKFSPTSALKDKLASALANPSKG